MCQALLGTGDKAVNKTKRWPSLLQVFMGVRGKENKQVTEREYWDSDT